MADTSIDDLPLPLMNPASEPQKRRYIPPAPAGHSCKLFDHGAAIDHGPACGSHPLEPSHEAIAGNLARGVKLASNVANGFRHVAANDRFLLTRIFDQGG